MRTATPGCECARPFRSDSSRTAPRTCFWACSRTCAPRTAPVRASRRNDCASSARTRSTRAVNCRRPFWRAELRLDESRELIPRGEAGAFAYVVVVEEDREQPHVVAGGFHLFVVVRADLAWRLLDRVAASAVELDELEGFDFLRLAVFRHIEVGLRKIRDRVAGLVRNDHVHTDEVDAGTEDRGLRRIGWRRL